jgi:hypothetical protein
MAPPGRHCLLKHKGSGSVRFPQQTLRACQPSGPRLRWLALEQPYRTSTMHSQRQAGQRLAHNAAAGMTTAKASGR